MVTIRPADREVLEEQRLIVRNGRVSCPGRGVVDLEVCFDCPRFRGFREGTSEDLICAYEAIPGLPGYDMTTAGGSITEEAVG
jgi:hypothetical protein